MNFKAVVDQAPDRPKDIDVTVSSDGCSIKPRSSPTPWPRWRPPCITPATASTFPT